MMPDRLGFDLYDERWRDCWVAATSAARLRKRQVDMDIGRRVARLLEDHGPQSSRPLTLRIYGTMLKGFCVINNERARALLCDCDRVVLMFARKPFAKADSGLSLPAAKRPRMEAALTLDLDLARVERAELFDWTQAPLEEGALLRLGGAQVHEALPSMETSADGVSHLAALGAAPPPPPEPGSSEPPPAGAGGVGWLPKLEDVQADPSRPYPVPEGAPQSAAPEPQAPPAGPPDPLMLQLSAVEAQAPAGPADPAANVHSSMGQVPPQPPGPGEVLAVPHRRGRREPQVKPGLVYGFDDEPMIPLRGLEHWQSSADEITHVRKRPTLYAEDMAQVYEIIDHLSPHLRVIIDPPDEAFKLATEASQRSQPDREAGIGGAAPPVQSLLSQPEVVQGPPVGEPVVRETPVDVGGQLVMAPEPFASAPAHSAGLARAAAAATEAIGPEAQDDRTAEVGEIIRGVLRSGGVPGAAFEDLVPPGAADRATAACTFSALLALASAGEFVLAQSEPYGRILISECVG